MSRRFLTAEDVRRAAADARASGAREIRVDASTVVTPHAMEEAERMGLSIRSGQATWSEPAPDRGPDAERAQRSLPHLPEPTPDEEVPTGVVVTAVGKNRPGVLAEVTAVLNAAQANVLNVSQRVSGEYFHLILQVELAPQRPFGELKNALQCLGGEDDYVVRVLHERVFRFMHRV